MLKLFKKISKKSQEFSIKIKLKVKFPVFFDQDKINEGLENYFDSYFLKNPIDKAHYMGIDSFLFGGGGFFPETCTIQFVFDKHLISFINDQTDEIIRKEVAKIIGIEISQIHLEVLSFDGMNNKIGTASSILEQFNNLKAFNDDLKTLNDDISDEIQKLKKMTMEREKESSIITNAYNQMRSEGLTDSNLDKYLDELEEEHRKEQEKIKGFFSNK